MDIFRNEFYISVGYECLQSDVVYVFLRASVKARCAFFAARMLYYCICPKCLMSK